MIVKVFSCDDDELQITINALAKKKYIILRKHRSLLTDDWKISAIASKTVLEWPEHRAFRRLYKLSDSIFARQ